MKKLLPALALLPTLAMAHTGVETHSSFLTGFLHPLTGWDHLVALVLLGVFLAVGSKKSAIGMLSFVSLALILGFVGGVYWAHASVVEGVVFASLFALPVCVSMYRSAGLVKALAVVAVGVFSACHGLVQGAEAYGALVQYAAGTMVSSLITMAVVGFFVKALFAMKSASAQRV